MTRSRLVRERAQQNAQRIGTHVATTSFPHNKKLAKALELANGHDGERCYCVMADAQGVGYLRVTPVHFLVNTGKSIELIEMDTKTIKSRAIKSVPEASVMDAAKVLANPLVDQVIISKRAKLWLDKILNDKELKEMATAKKAGKKAAPAKKASSGPRGADVIVKFKKMADEKDLPGQAFAILKVLKTKGEITVGKLIEALKGKIETSQGVAKIWAFYKKRLIDGKYVEVAK